MHTRLVRAVAALSIATLVQFGSAAGPATAASPPTRTELAFVTFNRLHGEPTSMDLSVSSSGGTVTLDAQWTSITCQQTDAGLFCIYVRRTVAAATPATFDFSPALDQAAVSADVSYGEIRWTCTLGLDTESCTPAIPAGSGSTHINVVWTATGPAQATTFRDEAGQVFVQRIAPAKATGEAFGEVFTPERDEGSQLAITELVQPGP